MIRDHEEILFHTPKRSALIWHYLPASKANEEGARVGILVPYGTAYFRFLQTRMYDHLARMDQIGPKARDQRAATIRSWLDLRRLRPRLIKLNAMATAIWELCDGRRAVRDILTEVADSQDEDENILWGQLCAFLESGHREGIINLDFPDPPSEGYPALIRRQMEGGTLQDLLRDEFVARGLDELFSVLVVNRGLG